MKPRILISASEGHMENYIRAVEKAGAIPEAFYAPIAGAENYDGLILAGGGDITPELYGETNEGLCSGMDAVRENSDKVLIAAFVQAGKPILGICRGMQILNVYFGGTMVQDLGEKRVTHTGSDDVDKYHNVSTVQKSLLSKLYGTELEVNSFHHQALKAVASDFAVTCLAADGIIEAVEHKTMNIVGVQWHPERYEGGAKLIEHFIEQCKGE